MTFEDFELDYDLLDGIDAMGYRNATPIQEAAIPLILQHKDLIACAQTGTGKTAAFVLPILHKIITTEVKHINTLVLVPTRELAQQIDQQIEAMAYYIEVSSIAVYGGNDGVTWEQQKRALKKGADIIIATPGRLISLINMKAIDFSQLQHLVLDEADRMLDMGFSEDIDRIVKELPENRQTLLFSATMPPKIRNLAHKILKHPEQINIAISKPAEGIIQQVYFAHDSQKEALLKQILGSGQYKSIIVFASTKEKVKSVYQMLRRTDMTTAAFHSDLKQEEREQIMQQFKNKNISVLVGTDVLSRGIDVTGIDLVLNYDVPPDPEDYIHRIGRTARAATTGTAITFVNEKDMYRLAAIEKLMERRIDPVPLPEVLGKGPEYRPDAKPQRHSNNKRSFHKKPGNWPHKKSS
ncbi:DEAD/DEAH box helicase [Rurimicrobium arvi]|uniref:DEAD/DEAH box helicase n=1 Tax=Rurimicrobium arvi TaxID=2049916 RepID=A0ABP8MGH5_9BACT